MRALLLLAGQLLGTALVLLGVVLLAGPAWAALLGGIALLALCTLAEMRPPVVRKDST